MLLAQLYWTVRIGLAFEALKEWIENLDFNKRHSLESVASPHYLKKIEHAVY